MQVVSSSSAAAELRKWIGCLLCLAVVAGVSPRGTAQAVPRLVKDLQATPVDYWGDFRAVGDMVYLAGYKHATGYELWKSDGTPEGTHLLKELNPGRNGSFPSEFTPVGKFVFFSALQEPSEIGNELWKTDGTPEGTTMVKDINPGSFSSPRNFFAWQNQLVFSADDGEHGTEPWISDGTPEGTRMLKDIVTGTGDSMLSCFTPTADRLYFMAESPGDGSWRRIYFIEGASGKVGYLSPKEFRLPNCLASLGGFLYFTAIERSTGKWKLWKSDGTVAGTHKVTDMSLSGYDEPVVLQLGSRILFAFDGGTSNARLWSTEGTEATTVNLGNVGVFNYFKYNGIFTAPGETKPSLYFSGSDSEHGVELWRTDGTAAGTGLFKDLSPGRGNSYPNRFSVAGDALYFRSGRNGDGDNLLWVSKGTSASTRLVKKFAREVSLQEGSSDSIYFKADDGLGNGSEIWKSSGSASSTVRLTDFMGTKDSSDFELSRVEGDKVRFWITTDNGYRDVMYETDGTEAGTRELPDMRGDCLVGDTVFFQGINKISDFKWDYELYKNDGTAAGTGLLRNIRAKGSSYPWNFNAVGNVVCFTADDGVHGRELWRSDGETSGTFMLRDLIPGKGGSALGNFIQAGNVLFFTRIPGFERCQLWRTDGTTAGTYRLAETDRMRGFRLFGDTLVFNASPVSWDGAPVLWRSDGKIDGTFPVSEAPPGTQPLEGGSYHAIQSTSFSTSVDLWKSDGTAGGTLKVSRRPGKVSLDHPEVEPVGGLVAYCMVKDGRNELWMSDGTEAGTKKVELLGGGANWVSNQMVEGNTLFFIAGADGDYRLWKSDGTPEGTGVVLLDIYKSDAFPFFWKAGNNVYFPMRTEAYGNELHVLPISELRIAEEAYADWAQGRGLASDQVAPQISPHGDGVENLLKYAFFMDGAGADRHVMTPGDGIDGLPSVTTSMNPSGGRNIRVEFIRRKNSGLVYRPLFSKSLERGSFVPMNGNQVVSDVDAVRERVIAEHAVEDQSQMGFGVVEVSME